MEPIVYVIDDDEAVLEALELLLHSVQLKVCTFVSAAAFLDEMECGGICTTRACLITDVRMPGISGLDLLAVLASRNIHVPMIIISGHADVPQAVRAMRAGALTVLEKPVNEQELIDTIREALTGSQQTQSARDAHHDDAMEQQRARLTPRQREVFDHLMKGLQTKEVAAVLGLSPRTVEVHRAKILERLNVTSFSRLLQQMLARSS